MKKFLIIPIVVLTLSQAYADTIKGDGFTTVLIGTSAADSIYGYEKTVGMKVTDVAFKEILQGKNGDDTLYGNGGDDILYGDVGMDTLYGGNGNDLLGDGNEYKITDTMWGQSGIDLFQTSFLDTTNKALTSPQIHIRDFDRANETVRIGNCPCTSQNVIRINKFQTKAPDGTQAYCTVKLTCNSSLTSIIKVDIVDTNTLSSCSQIKIVYSK